MIFEVLQINYQDYHQLERGAFNAKCGEHDLVHKEKHQDTGADGNGDDDDGDDTAASSGQSNCQSMQSFIFETKPILRVCFVRSICLFEHVCLLYLLQYEKSRPD